jgi:hypothetical protein
MMADKIGRRQFLRVSAMAAAGATVVACQPQTVIVKETVEVEKQVTTVVEKEVEKEVTKVVEKEVTKIVEKEKIVEVEGASDKQAPALMEMVKAGSLPPLDERLPKNPKVLSKARNEIPQGDLDLTIGKYGGIIRTTQPAPDWQPDIFVATDEPLCRRRASWPRASAAASPRPSRSRTAGRPLPLTSAPDSSGRMASR